MRHEKNSDKRRTGGRISRHTTIMRERKLEKIKNDMVIINGKVAPGLFIPGTVFSNKCPNVRILNMNKSEHSTFKNKEIINTSLENFELRQLQNNDKRNRGRKMVKTGTYITKHTNNYVISPQGKY